MVEKDGELLPPPSDVGGTIGEDENELLSQIINKVNEVFGIDLGKEDMITVQQRLSEDKELYKVMTGDNSETNKRKKHNEVLGKIVLSYVNERLDFYQKMENPKVKEVVSDYMYRNYYSSVSG